MLYRMDKITRYDLQRNPATFYLFGDNMGHIGRGGQAKEMRGEPNALGIPTKWGPCMQPECFFKESDYDVVVPAIARIFDFVEKHLKLGHKSCNSFRGDRNWSS